VRIDFVTLFPEMVLDALRHSIVGRAWEAGLVEFGASNPRDHAYDAHRSVDDRPYGGGPGMVLRPDVVGRAIDALGPGAGARLIVTEPAGRRFDQALARELAAAPRLVFVCGHYEGIDARVAARYGATAVSLGDFVLTGGELAALAITDAVVRLLPGALGAPESLEADSHAAGLFGCPQYTRPPEWEGLAVPPELLSGDHAAIARWRRREALLATRSARPDLFCLAPLRKGDLDLLQ
jgi:tRNA (guanine37-N1)-methyltransferase